MPSRLLFFMVRREILFALRRPLFWIFLLVMVLFTVGYFLGGVRVAVDSGGLGEEEKVHINGPYLLAIFHMAIPFVVATLFAAIAMATTIVRDEELGVEEVLRGTHLSARQYVLGKLVGTGAWVIGVLLLGLLAALVSDSITAGIAASGGMSDPEKYGAFDPLFHLYPFAVYTLPWFLFAMSVSFWLGERTRSPIVIFGSLALLYAFVLSFASFSPEFLERWSRDTLNVEWSTIQGWLDPSGLSWMSETYGKEDRGVRFYNSVIPTLDLPFLVNRLVLVVLSGICLLGTLVRYGRTRHGALAAVDRRAKESDAKVIEPLLPGTLSRGRGRRGRGGFLRVLRAELRLLTRQPSLWVFTPLIWLFAIPAVFFSPGPWQAKVIVTSSYASSLLVQALSPWICAYGACLMIEVMSRERVTRFADVYFSSPVSTLPMILGKITAVVLALLFMIGGTAGITMVFQSGFSGTTVEPLVYAEILGVILVPGVLFFVVVAAFFTSVGRGRGAAYGLLLAFGLLYIVGLFTSWLDWRGKVIPASLVIPSDISGLRPYARELFLNRMMIGSVILALLMLTVRLFPRTDRSMGRRIGLASLRSARLGTAVFVLLVGTAVASGVALDRAMDQGPDGEWREDAIDEYELANRIKWGENGRKVPDYAAMDLRLDLFPETRSFRVDGSFTFINRTDEVFRVLPLTVGLDLDLDGEGIRFGDRKGWEEEERAQVVSRKRLLEVLLPAPLRPGDGVTLHLRYGGTVGKGAGKTSGGMGEWILEDGIFVDSFGPDLIPAVGYVEPKSPRQDTADDGMSPEELAAHYEGHHSAALGGHGTYDVRIEVGVPAGLTALSVGKLVGQREEEGRSVFVYETDHPVYFFPVMAGRYAVREEGQCKVYYHPPHGQNIDTIAETLDRSRRFYSAVFSEFPFEELRIVEFPRVAGFAMGHPTLIPFSEALGFLTVGDDGISNINFMVTAHEVAHQWWGNITTPAPVPGASFLTEALAHYSTLLMEERFNGRVAARNRRLEFEKLYLESRKADVERPVVRIDGSESSDQSLWYNKGGLVFWMSSETIGREAFLSALRAFIGEFSFQHDHPTIFDLIRHIREEAGPEHEAFLRQWFFEVVLPRPEVVSAESRAKDGGYETLVVVRNAGTGTIDLEVELANRRRVSTEIGIQPRPTRLRRDDLPEAEGWVEEERTDDEGDAEKVSRAAGASREPYRAVRTGIRLAAGEEKSVTLFTEFEVKHVLLDPDAELLVAGRHGAQKGL